MKKYIITTLENQPARGQNVIRLDNQISGYLNDANIIIAPDWRIFKHTELTEKQWKHQSLTLAYYNICMRQLYWGSATFVICEDDLHIFNPKDFTQHTLDFSDTYHKTGADFGYLALTDHNIQSAQVEEFNGLWNQVKANYWETPATIWTQKMARIFVDHISAKLEKGIWVGHIDHELLQIHLVHKLLFLCPKTQFCAGLSTYKTPPVEFDRSGSISEI